MDAYCADVPLRNCSLTRWRMPHITEMIQ